MRAFLTAAGLLFSSVLVSPVLAVSVTMSPPPKVLPPAPPKPAAKAEAKPACPCNCPKPAKHQARAHVTHRRFASATYHYASAAPFHPSWRAPYYQPYGEHMSYGPSHAYEEGLHIDRDGWSGGVGYAAEGGGGGGFVDGYGQLHFATGNENGPTYNSYNQSFQTNPSQAGPFQPRLMGGFAPSGTGSQ